MCRAGGGVVAERAEPGGVLSSAWGEAGDVRLVEGAVAEARRRSAEATGAATEGGIGAVGLSMGSHRTWMLNAVSDRIAAAVAICWMCTTDALMTPGNNQTKG